jgi:hypothetical protein
LLVATLLFLHALKIILGIFLQENFKFFHFLHLDSIYVFAVIVIVIVAVTAAAAACIT